MTPSGDEGVIRDTADRLSTAGARSLDAGVDLLASMLGSGRQALAVFTDSSDGQEARGVDQPRVFVESVMKGYLEFFQEMASAATRVADVYRSDSGRLVGKGPPRESAEGRVFGPTGRLPLPGEFRRVTDQFFGILSAHRHEE